MHIEAAGRVEGPAIAQRVATAADAVFSLRPASAPAASSLRLTQPAALAGERRNDVRPLPPALLRLLLLRPLCGHTRFYASVSVCVLWCVHYVRVLGAPGPQVPSF